MPQIQLPTFYYHDHFMEMLSFVTSVCGDCLSPVDRAFVERLQALPHPERCLYIRMANRKGTIFDLRTLRYAEIDDLPLAAAGLRDKAFIRPLADGDLPEFLQHLTKDEIVLLCREAEVEIKSSWPKARLAAEAALRLHGCCLADLWPCDPYIVRAEVEALDYLLFLYFGRNRDDLKAFALRDLGLVETHARNRFQSRFADSAEASYCFACIRAEALLKRGDEAGALALVAALGPAPSDYAQACHGRIVHKLGLACERAKNPERAIRLYRLSPAPECRERLVRLLYAAGDKDEARILLERVIDDPGSDGEHDFASDFYQRKYGGARIGALTGLLRQGTTIRLDDIHRGNPELGAVASYRRDGWDGRFTENYFWHHLFGLLFWDELFGPEADANNGFDLLPFSLIKGTFRQRHTAAIDRTLDAVAAGRGLPIVLKTVAAAWGQPNGLIAWEYLDIEGITACLKAADPAGLASLLGAMAARFMDYRDGFPDLMLARDGAVKFVEVKAEGDSIRRNQLTRMRQLRAAGFETEICRIDYGYDPQQTYVVLDVETTGSSAAYGRVTEIGAVKLRGNEVVGEWHSLINPQRPIPAFITGLTGITNAMVSDAPLFVEIAADLAAFLEDSIFVAHNVNFDYGFIAAEFARNGHAFRLPKLCTCAGMRRYFPGHASYSLATLCALYDIELENHHRALDDAKAASRLLMLITDRRERLAA